MSDRQEAVDAWFDAQAHSMTAAARTVRETILDAVPDATECVKWNAPNFATEDDFATFSMRRPGILQVILHTGAKPKPGLSAIRVDDLGGRLRWAGHNRAVITFTSAADVADALPQFVVLIRTWTARTDVV